MKQARQIILGIAIAAVPVIAWANCTYNRVCSNGQCQNCTTCCYGGYCNTNCY